MKKKLALACLLACSVFSSGASLPQAIKPDSSVSIALQLNGQAVALSSLPRLIDNTLMVPLRDLSEALGVQVEWNAETLTAKAWQEDQVVSLTAGSTQALRQGIPVRLDTAPLIAEGKLFVPARFFSEAFHLSVYWDGPGNTVSIADASQGLPVVGTAEHLQQLLSESSPSEYAIPISGAVVMEDSSVMIKRTAAKEKAAVTAPAAAASEAAPAYSGTNVQVEGVDEADIIKTDGTYIYQVNKNRVVITQAYPADQMKTTRSLSFDDSSFRPQELYVDDKYMVVIGSAHYPKAASPSAEADIGSPPSVQPVEKGLQVKRMIVPIQPQQTVTRAMVYELGDRSNGLSLVRTVELEGSYISSRKTGSSLYMVTSKPLAYYPMLRLNGAAEQEITEQQKTLTASAPAYKDTAAGTELITIGLEDVRYFPESVKSSYLMIGGIQLDQPGQQMSVQSYLGSGNQVYTSEKHLYVAAREYTPMTAQPQDRSSSIRRMAAPGDESTVIYKFGINEGSIRYDGRGKVPGHIINSFAMDESNGYFRIATTLAKLEDNSRYVTANQMYVLDEALNMIGKIEDIAPGEQIYSVRYTGDRAYMVTFRTVDPLFVMDLKDPQMPKIAGKLKIPGYSNYLHPYDDNHVIGFGKDTVEIAVEGGNAPSDVPQTAAFYQGMKMALFDITDVAHPKELYVEAIGDRGTDSELLYNHKALLFSKEQGLLAFPVTLREVRDSEPAAKGSKIDAAARYGAFSFQGAYVYQLNLTDGFMLKGRITHLTPEDDEKSGESGAAYQRYIHRMLTIGDTLYTSSEQMLKATQLSSFRDVSSVTLP